MATSIIRNSDIVSVLRATVKKDEYNSEFLDWSNPETIVSARASIQHFLTTEDDTDRQTTTEGLRLVSDDPAIYGVLQPTDRISYAGEVYEIDAPIQEWRLFGMVHHIEVYLKRVVG